MLKKILYLAFCVAALWLIAMYFKAQNAEVGPVDIADGKNVIKIGVILPLSGPVQEIGEITKKAVLLAEKDLADRYLKNEYEIIIEDADSLSIAKTNAALRKLINIDKVNAVLTCLPTAGNVAAEAVKNTDIIHINWGDDHTTIIKPNDFRYYAYVPEQAELILDFFKREGKTNIAIFAGNNAYGTLATNDVMKKAKELGIEVVDTVKVNLEEHDFRMVLKKMEQKDPDVYFLLIDKPAIEIARKEMLELGIDKPVTAIDVFDFVNEPALFEGMTYVTAFAGDDEFLRRYKAFSGLENTFGSTFLYDMVNMVVEAFENLEIGEASSHSLEGIKVYDGANGEVIQDENYFKAKSILRKIENGKYILVKE